MSLPINLQAAYVLHTRAYKESSLLLELLTPEGRISVIAKGAKRPKSHFRGILQAFIPLSISCVGRHELKTLTYAEVINQRSLLQGDYLLAGLYVNELLMRLLLKEEPCAKIFGAYETMINALFMQHDLFVCLRLFEKAVLQFLGYELNLSHDVYSGELIQPDAQYIYLLEKGPVRLETAPLEHANAYVFLGKSLLDLATEDLCDPRSRQQSKQLLRQALQAHLGDKALHSPLLLTKTVKGPLTSC